LSAPLLGVGALQPAGPLAAALPARPGRPVSTGFALAAGAAVSFPLVSARAGVPAQPPTLAGGGWREPRRGHDAPGVPVPLPGAPAGFGSASAGSGAGGAGTPIAALLLLALVAAPALRRWLRRRRELVRPPALLFLLERPG
jgi:hypothetical protein